MSNDSRNHNFDYVELPAASAEALAAAKRFYHRVFEWNYQDWGAEYADTKNSGITSGLAVDGARLGKPLPVIFAADLEATRTRVFEAGGKIAKDIFSFPGGRRFHFLDPAGNELAVWSDH